MTTKFERNLYSEPSSQDYQHHVRSTRSIQCISPLREILSAKTNMPLRLLTAAHTTTTWIVTGPKAGTLRSSMERLSQLCNDGRLNRPVTSRIMAFKLLRLERDIVEMVIRLK